MTEPLETPGAGASVAQARGETRPRRPAGRAATRPHTTERNADNPRARAIARRAAMREAAATVGSGGAASSIPTGDAAPQRAARPDAHDQSLPALIGQGARRWIGLHAQSLPIVIGLMIVAVALVGTGIGHYPSLADDEGTYVAEAWSFITHGQLSQYTYWYDHPPLAWMQLGVLTWLFGGIAHGATAVITARRLMLLPALATTGLLYVLARRIGMRRGFAALAVLTLICSPLGITSLREVYLENFAIPWLLAAFVLAASPKRRLWAFAGSGACFAVSVLSKETFLLYLPGLVLANVYNSDRRTRSFTLTAFAAAFVLIAGAYPLYSVLKGELLPGKGHVSLEQAVVWQLFTRQASGSVFDSGSEARSLVNQWLGTDPWLLGLGVIAIVPSLLVKHLRPVALALAIAIVVAIHGGYLPEPFDIGLLPLCALLPAGLLDWLFGDPRRPRVRRAAINGARLRVVASLVLVVALVVAAAPGWIRQDRYVTSADLTSPPVAAERWVEAHVPRRARLMVDDTMYVDLVRAGFQPKYGVVWFSKMAFGSNLDPAVVRHLPRGWREFDYVIDTPALRNGIQAQLSSYKPVVDAISHSRVVTSFGKGKARVEIRRLYGVGIGSFRIPPATPSGTAAANAKGRAA